MPHAEVAPGSLVHPAPSNARSPAALPTGLPLSGLRRLRKCWVSASRRDPVAAPRAPARGPEGGDVQPRLLGWRDRVRPAADDAVTDRQTTRSKLGIFRTRATSAATSAGPLPAVGIAGGDPRLVRVILFERSENAPKTQFQLCDGKCVARLQQNHLCIGRSKHTAPFQINMIYR